MPQKRSELDRDEKVAQILAVAELQLVEVGAEGLSVARVARDLGVAQNTIYWYFPSRADLLVETVRRRLYAAAARKPRGIDTTERVLWWTDQLAEIYSFRPALQREAADSDVAAGFLSELDDALGRMLANAFRGRVEAEELEQATASFRAAVIGTYAERVSRKRRRAILRYTLERLWTT